jgi:hypothetical protein
MALTPSPSSRSSSSKDEEIPYVRDTLLKERVSHWRTELKGLVI